MSRRQQLNGDGGVVAVFMARLTKERPELVQGFSDLLAKFKFAVCALLMEDDVLLEQFLGLFRGPPASPSSSNRWDITTASTSSLSPLPPSSHSVSSLFTSEPISLPPARPSPRGVPLTSYSSATLPSTLSPPYSPSSSLKAITTTTPTAKLSSRSTLSSPLTASPRHSPAFNTLHTSDSKTLSSSSRSSSSSLQSYSSCPTPPPPSRPPTLRSSNSVPSIFPPPPSSPSSTTSSSSLARISSSSPRTASVSAMIQTAPQLALTSTSSASSSSSFGSPKRGSISGVKNNTITTTTPTIYSSLSVVTVPSSYEALHTALVAMHSPSHPSGSTTVTTANTSATTTTVTSVAPPPVMAARATTIIATTLAPAAATKNVTTSTASSDLAASSSSSSSTPDTPSPSPKSKQVLLWSALFPPTSTTGSPYTPPPPPTTTTSAPHPSPPKINTSLPASPSSRTRSSSPSIGAPPSPSYASVVDGRWINHLPLEVRPRSVDQADPLDVLPPSYSSSNSSLHSLSSYSSAEFFPPTTTTVSAITTLATTTTTPTLAPTLPPPTVSTQNKASTSANTSVRLPQPRKSVTSLIPTLPIQHPPLPRPRRNSLADPVFSTPNIPPPILGPPSTSAPIHSIIPEISPRPSTTFKVSHFFKATPGKKPPKESKHSLPSAIYPSVIQPSGSTHAPPPPPPPPPARPDDAADLGPLPVIRCGVSYAHIVKNGFDPAHVEYCLTVKLRPPTGQQLCWQVSRRFRQFKKLHSDLEVLLGKSLPPLNQPSGRGVLGKRNFDPTYVKANMIVLEEYISRILSLSSAIISLPLSLFLFPGFYPMFSNRPLPPPPVPLEMAIEILEKCIHKFNNQDTVKHNGTSQASHGRNFSYPAQIILRDLISRGLDYPALLAHLNSSLPPRFGPLARECFWAMAQAFRRYRLHLQAPPVETEAPLVNCCGSTEPEEVEEEEGLLWRPPLSDDEDEVVEVDTSAPVAVANRAREDAHAECVKSPWHCSPLCRKTGPSSRCYGRRSQHDDAMFSLAAILIQRWFRSPSYYYRKFERTTRRKNDQVAAKIMKLEVFYHTDCITKLQEKWDHAEVFDPAREDLLPEGWITGTFPGDVKRWYAYGGPKEETRSTGRRKSGGEDMLTTLHPLFDKTWTVQPVTWTDKKY